MRKKGITIGVRDHQKETSSPQVFDNGPRPLGTHKHLAQFPAVPNTFQQRQPLILVMTRLDLWKRLRQLLVLLCQPPLDQVLVTLVL